MVKFKLFNILVIAIGVLINHSVFSQDKSKRNVILLNISTVVVDETGHPLDNVIATINEGENVYFSDENGSISFSTKSNSYVKFEAEGYSSLLVNLAKEKLTSTVVLKFKQSDVMSRIDGGNVERKEIVGAVSLVTGDNLESYPDFSLSNTLQGRLSGVLASATVAGLGNNSSTIFVRGLHGYDENQAIVIVDGFERSCEDIIPEEIEKVEVLKDATAKILYGARAANGVIVITTKRGKINSRKINVSIEGGVLQATRLPKYLDSYQYTSLYNEARLNDGLPGLYTQTDLAGYMNSSGPNDLLYPNVDYYDNFLKNTGAYRKVVFDINGGTEKIRYALVANYIGGDGFEKIGKESVMSRLNVRGNLDIKANDILSIVAGGAVRMDLKSWGSVDNQSLFARMSSLRPNEYPFTISSEALEVSEDTKGIPNFGASLKQPANLYADVKYGGFTKERYLTSQTNLGLNVDLNSIVKGLKAGTYISFDNLNYFKQGQRNVYPTYAVKNVVDGNPVFLKMKKLSLQSNQSRLGEYTTSLLGWRANVEYSLNTGKNSFNTLLGYNYYMQEVKGGSQNIKNSTFSLRMNYDYDKKYFIEGDLAQMGSNRFSDKNRYFTAGALGAAWVLSEEDFFENIKFINFLKLKASFGILGYDRSTQFLLYQTAWKDGGTITWGEQNKGTSKHTTALTRLGNENLNWEKTTEYNIGLEGEFLKKRLALEINYFREYRDNIITQMDASIAGVVGNFKRYYNIGKVKNQGIELDIRWNDKIGNWRYSIGGNMLWSVNKILKRNELDYKDDGLETIGKSTDAILGYNSLGILGKDVAPENMIPQLLGGYQNGDLIYDDTNKDGLVDNRDRLQIGNIHPRVSLGIDFDIQYKGWGLYLLGVSELGFDVMKNVNYYFNRGEEKYSIIALDRYHPVNNPDGNYPRLTTLTGENNSVPSSFWLENGNYFRLKNMELSYTFSFKRNSSIVKSLKLFGRGTNLFVISKIKELDPENLSAGIANYPLYRTFTGGVSINF